MADLVLGGRSKEWFDIELPGYSFRLPNEIPTAPLIKAARCMVRFGEVAQGKTDASMEELDEDMEAIWGLVERIMKHADPIPTTPVRELLSEEDALQLAGFLATKFTAKQTTSNNSLDSPTSSEGLSQSNGSSEMPAMLSQPLESLSG